ncbi:RNA dependent RNA polymerase-domain-containing protein [Fusarium solani]|uniref:RNA-dependent RNA polymerase n=1 Tax=Fusarium solani TaxID=169388 RepID=A0A9P9GZ88_FUSSL|nr:RNA dependent RNA polymerase-domain-containing protein [Fusarium solani]KAH7248283.1 RNA dependent RNA polymerase-domain-containing protein [Fusarium solani]
MEEQQKSKSKSKGGVHANDINSRTILRMIDQIPVRVRTSRSVGPVHDPCTRDNRNSQASGMASSHLGSAGMSQKYHLADHGNMSNEPVSQGGQSDLELSSDDGGYSPTPSLIDAMEELAVRCDCPPTQDGETHITHELASKEPPVMQHLNCDSPFPLTGEDQNRRNFGSLSSLDLLWPKCPIGMRNAPMIVKWELHRVALYCSIDTAGVSLPYQASWKDQDTFWEELQQHGAFREKAFPQRCNARAWLESLSQEPRSRLSVIWKANLYLGTQEGEHKVELEPPVLEISSRLRRKFGFDRFIELQLLSSSLSKSFRDGDLKKSLAQWLVHTRQSFLHREWAAFFLQDCSIPPTFLKRVFIFAERGHGLIPSMNGEHAVTGTVAPAIRGECSRFDMLNWLLRFDRNTDQPYMKLFHRIQLGLSKATPTVVLAEHQIRNHHGDILSPKGVVMNDGIGRLSPSLMREVRNALGLESIPSVIQGRIGSAKGLWITDTTSVGDEKWIETYSSQRKWECDWSDPAHRTLDVVTSPSELQPANLNLQFVPILEGGAIDKELMRKTIVQHMAVHLRSDLERAKTAMRQPEHFRKWVHDTSYTASERSQSDLTFIGGLPKDFKDTMDFLVDGGFDPLKLQFLNDLVFRHQRGRWERVEDKLSVKVGQSTYAFMAVDFQKILDADEVHFCFSSSFNDGTRELHDLGGMDVLVGRCPAHLPSDIQKVKAVFRPELRNLKDIVIFPCTGDEPLAQRLSGGDYDGDRAWICWDPDMVNNFECVGVPPKPSFEKYFLPNARQLGDLISRHGKPHFLDQLLEEAFAFHLAPAFIGICTSHKEKLSYHKNSISEKSVINLSWLLSDLVDQDKSGFVFDEDIWRRIKREMGGGMLDLAPPAYKANTIGCPPETCHIIDYFKLNFSKIIRDGLVDFGKSLMVKDGDDGVSRPTTFDADLTDYWNSFEKEADEFMRRQRLSSIWISELRSNLTLDIEACVSLWLKLMNSSRPYIDKAVPACDSWRKIVPRVDCKSEVALAMMWSLKRQPFPQPDLDIWQLLKASLTFKLYHHRCPRFVWQVSGRQLQFIKASKGVASTQRPIPVIENMYRILRPYGKRLNKLELNQDQKLGR